MITPELIGYIRGEFAKKRTREQIREELIADGGWSDTDLAEAFRIVIPMQGFGENIAVATKKIEPSVSSAPLLSSMSASVSASKPSTFSFSFWKISIAVVIIGALGFAIWFYRAPISKYWNFGVNKVKTFSASFFSPKKVSTIDNVDVAVPPEDIIAKNIISVKDCGTGKSPDLKNPLTYQNDATMNCLGESALRCEEAKAVLTDPLFPSSFQIVKNGGSCNFKLSYPEDSTLVDATGVKLSGQYISCPLSVVKSIDESKKVPIFSAPSVENFGKYGAQIYFYGTLGLFMENGIDQSRIQSLGCSGPYINSVIASYQKMQSKK